MGESTYEDETDFEELWQTQDDLLHEAGEGVARIGENTRRWAGANPHSGPVVGDAAELRT